MALNELSAVFQAQKKFDQALSFARTNIALKIAEHDTANLPQGYYGLGCIFYDMDEMDSAKVYFNKSLHTNNLYTLSNAYLGLSNIAREENNDKASDEYHRLYKTYHDSIYKKPTVKELADVQSDYEYDKLETATHKSERSSFYHKLALCSIIIFLIIVFYFILRKKNLKISQSENNQQALADYETKIEQTEQNIHALQKANTQLKEELATSEENLQEKDWHISKFRQNLQDLINYFRKTNQALPSNIHILKKEELSLLVQETDLMYNNFSKRLQKAYPSLTKEDISYCCLLKLGFTYKEIAKMYPVSNNAVLKRKYRIGERIPHSDPLWKSVNGDLQRFIELW